MNVIKPPRGLSTLPRRLLALVGAALLCAFLLPAAAAQADNSSTLTIVGTSDVSDSGLIPNLIGPEFEQAYPQFAFKYLGNATLAAITDAETGKFSPSMLIVHAASLENQFVSPSGGGSYSYGGQYGYAIFRNDFVLVGPTGDPAGVDPSGANNIVQAFVNVAKAGINSGGTPLATFVSRGGAPGTVVAEHAIWQMVDQLGLAPTGLLLCAVSSAQGGGEAPIATGQGVTANGQACPNSGANPTESMVPDWYVVTGLTQGPNVVFANTCTTSGTSVINSGANSCYVFTDRGTYDYLASGTEPNPGASNSFFTIPNLTILTRNNSASAPGGANELNNFFHAYIINPSAPCGGCESVNVPAAQDFIKFITSAPIQAQLQNYLAFNTGDPGGAPFVADASPTVTANGMPSAVNAGTKVTVTGNVTTNELGYPALQDVPVEVDQVVAGVDIPVAPGTTDSNGAYTISFVPPGSGSYQVTSAQVSQVENPTLSPVFGDIQSPGASATSSITVTSAIAIAAVHAASGGVVVSGTVDPAPLDNNGKVTILARPAGSSASFSEIGAAGIAKGQSGYAVFASLNSGNWQIEASYSDPGQFATSTSAVASLTVSNSSASHSVAFSKVSAKKGKITVKGSLKPGPTSSGAKVELLALRAGRVSKGKTKKTARIAGAALRVVGKTSVGTGKTSFTIKAKLTRGYSWILELEYVQSGQTSAFSKLRTVAVH